MCDLETSRIGAPYIYIYIYDISSLRVKYTKSLIRFLIGKVYCKFFVHKQSEQKLIFQNYSDIFSGNNSDSTFV